MQLAPHGVNRVAYLRNRRAQRGFRNTKLLRPISDLMVLFHADLAAVLRTTLRSIVCHWRSPCSFSNITRNYAHQFRGTACRWVLQIWPDQLADHLDRSSDRRPPPLAHPRHTGKGRATPENRISWPLISSS